MFPKGKNASDWKKACDGVMGILSTMGYSLGTLANYSGVDKNFLSFLFQRKLIDKPVDKKHTDAFFRYFDDTPHGYVTTKLYQADVKKLLSAIDRKTDLGKRDYAIILLVARTGIRIGEALNLKIENIDWRKATLHVTQPKTNNTLELPMSEDIGNALIDYLVNGHPSVLSRHGEYDYTQAGWCG